MADGVTSKSPVEDNLRQEGRLRETLAKLSPYIRAINQDAGLPVCRLKKLPKQGSPQYIAEPQNYKE
jgi:hypothetical protein